MVLLSYDSSIPQRPEPLGPVPAGCRRVVLTCALGLPNVRGEKNEVLDLPEQVALDMIALGNAFEPAQDLSKPPEPELPTAPDGGKLKMPPIAASKSAWIDWAVSQGAIPSEAVGMTKAQLQNEYSDRL